MRYILSTRLLILKFEKSFHVPSQNFALKVIEFGPS